MGEQELRRRRADRGADEADLAEYRAVHGRLSDRVERLIMQLVILGLVGVVLVQTLAVNPDLRRKLNLLEGTDGYVLREDSSWWQSLAPGAGDRQVAGAGDVAGVAASAAERHRLTVLLETTRSAPKVKLLVGGRAVADFATGKVTAEVKAGELVDVDATDDERELTFRVVASDGLSAPVLGHEVTTRGERKALGVARKAAP
jgi:hypothetical protein